MSRRARPKPFPPGALSAFAVVVSVLGSSCGPGSEDVTTGGAGSGAEGDVAPGAVRTILESESRFGSLRFTPAAQAIEVEAGVETVAVTYQVENTGGKPVVIEDLESGCACLELVAEPPLLAPGDRGVIRGVFTVRKLTGPAEKRISVQTSEDEQRRASLGIRLEVRPVYEIEPELVQWSIGGEAETKTVVFRTVRDEPVRVLEAVSMRDAVRCSWEEVVEGREYHIHLTPESTGESLLGFVRIRTDLEIPDQARALAYFSIQ